MSESSSLMLSPTTLKGEFGAVVPLSHVHCEALAEASAEAELWKIWYTSVPSPEDMAKAIDWRLAQQEKGMMLPFTILDANGVPVGMTTYCNVEPDTPRLEIGYTWYGKRVQRTALNTQCKLLLLSRAFDDLDCLAVEFRTSFFNRQSRAAIERLGAKLDGVLRSHRRYPDGSLRDTCVYSITASEWPAVRQNLRFRLERG